MKQKLNKIGGGVLLALVIGSLLAIFAGGGLITADSVANPVRTLPDMVYPGQTFQVTVTFTSPAAQFNSIGLKDLAPAGWTVSVDRFLCTPVADVDHHPTTAEADYIWYGPYGSGAGFTAVYNVTVPGNATVGIYNFPDGTLEYYIAAAGPTTENITGNYQIEVVKAIVAGVTKDVKCALMSGVNVTAYQGAVAIRSTLSNGTGNYRLGVPAFGDYNVTASKAGFRSETQAISVVASTIYTLDFVGDHGLVPNAPDMSYVLACINLWKYGTPPCALTLSKVLSVINAWKNPIV